MSKLTFLFLTAMLLAPLAAPCAAETPPVACWTFDEARESNVTDRANGRSYKLFGATELVPGVHGKALKFDGFTSRLACAARDLPRFGPALTVEAWIAPQEYSWNWTGLVDREQATHSLPRAGFSFGINHLGQIGLYAAIEGQWQGCLSREAVPLLKWSHVAGVFDPAGGFKVYINGKLAAESGAKGTPAPAPDTELWLGTSHRKQYAAGTERLPSKRFLSAMVFDGLMDEVRVYPQALSAKAVERSFASVKLANPQPLRYRRIPTGPAGPGRFGAYYTRLKYCPEWDRLWRVADHPDIVVRFDESPAKLIFWRGTGYIPYWAAENGVCVADEGVESAGAWGCCEAMSDKQCRYSHVRIIESTPARAVVHWRTASPDIRYESNHVNPDTGWGEWTDEYYYTYPDGVSVRYQLVHSDGIKGWMEFQQTQTLNQPGTRPQDNLEAEAVTVLNMDGETGSYIWDRPYGRPVKTLATANIQVINLKARNRHYVIGETGSHWRPFSFGAPPWSFFPCWNHWPVAQLPSDGCVAAAPDRPSSSCVGTLYPVKHKLDDATMFARDLYGMTDRPVSTLVTLARSWNFPPELKVTAEGIASQGYDKSQRAYMLLAQGARTPVKMMLKLVGNERSPVYNPAFVIKNWGETDVKLTLDGRKIARGKEFRLGHVPTLEGVNLVLWIQCEAKKSILLMLEKISI